MLFWEILTDYPSASNSTHTLFRVWINYVSQVATKARMKYLACPSSLTSNNLRFWGVHFTPNSNLGGGLASCYSYTYAVPINTTNSYTYSLWISAIKATRPSSADPFIINSDFSIPDQFSVCNPLASSAMYVY